MMKPPFCWCHDEEIPAAVFADSGNNSPADATPVAPKPQEGEVRTCSWDELLYLMTHGEMGTKPQD